MPQTQGQEKLCVTRENMKTEGIRKPESQERSRTWSVSSDYLRLPRLCVSVQCGVGRASRPEGLRTGQVGDMSWDRVYSAPGF